MISLLRSCDYDLDAVYTRRGRRAASFLRPFMITLDYSFALSIRLLSSVARLLYVFTCPPKPTYPWALTFYLLIALFNVFDFFLFSFNAQCLAFWVAKLGNGGTEQSTFFHSIEVHG